MGCPHAQNHIDSAPVAIATITPQHQGSALHTGKCAKHRFNEAFEVVRLFELSAALTKARSAGLLICERGVESDQVLGRIHGGRGGHHRG